MRLAGRDERALSWAPNEDGRHKHGDGAQQLRAAVAGISERQPGNTLLAEAKEKLQKIEASIQQYSDDNMGAVPTKEYELHVVVKLLATDEFRRQVSWAVDLKEPKAGKTHLQDAHAADGRIVTMDPAAFQAMLPLER